MKKILYITVFLSILVATTISIAATSTSSAETPPQKFSSTTSYTVCFTPGENCTNKIVKSINKAQQSILVQAYTITSHPIENALIKAMHKGINVKIILDKNQYLQIPKSITYLLAKKLPIWVDYNLAGLAHNKVMIIDSSTVITGSFNFTRAAQKNNAENLLIIKDNNLARRYAKNWQKRFAKSCDLTNKKCEF